MKGDLNIFKACADETRLRILFLLTEGELCVCELVAVLGMPQGKISRHLGVLKQADLVVDRREGTWIYYSLTLSNGGLKRVLNTYFKKERTQLAVVQDDLARLKNLSDQGEICVPRPSPVLVGVR